MSQLSQFPGRTKIHVSDTLVFTMFEQEKADRATGRALAAPSVMALQSSGFPAARICNKDLCPKGNSAGTHAHISEQAMSQPTFQFPGRMKISRPRKWHSLGRLIHDASDSCSTCRGTSDVRSGSSFLILLLLPRDLRSISCISSTCDIQFGALVMRHRQW